MLSLFKSNNPAVVVLYVLYIVLFRLCFLLVPADVNFVFNYREPLSQLVFSFLHRLPLNYAITSMVLSSILCFIQAFTINAIVVENKILPRNNYLAGLLF